MTKFIESYDDSLCLRQTTGLRQKPGVKYSRTTTPVDILIDLHEMKINLTKKNKWYLHLTRTCMTEE